VAGMARNVTALSRRRPEDGSPGPCPPRLRLGLFVTVCHSVGNPAVTEYRITVARIETDARDAQDKEICVTFQVERAPISFQIPIFLNTHDFDDTEMIQVARNILHRIFMQLAAESRDWKLTTAEMQRLSKLNLGPTKLPA
jgi:hypothetical protein